MVSKFETNSISKEFPNLVKINDIWQSVRSYLPTYLVSHLNKI